MGDPTTPAPPARRFVLRYLPLPARLVLTTFLLCVGIGYLSALVQLKFQHADKGQLFPDREQTYKIFHDERGRNPAPVARPVGKMETLIAADPTTEKWGSNGQMSAAFTNDKGEFRTALDRLKEQLKAAGPQLAKLTERLHLKDLPAAWTDKHVEEALYAEREGERQAVLAWLAAGAPEDAYTKDAFPLPDGLKDRPITPELTCADGQSAKVKSILDARCARCHGKDGEQEDKPLNSYAAITCYLPPKTETADPNAAQPGLSLTRLAQSTHVHLLGFSMLYALTGFVLVFSRLPNMAKMVLCPLPLVVQVLDISCWWLARLDKPQGPFFADVIPVTGGIVGLGLVLHIGISVFDMYGWIGKGVLVGLFTAAIGGGVVFVKPIVERTLEREKADVETAKKKAAEAAKKTVEEAIKVKEPQKKEQPPSEPKRGPELSRIEKMLELPTKEAEAKQLPLNVDKLSGEGQMSTAFLYRLEKKVPDYQQKHGMGEGEAKEALYQEREGERRILLEWVRAGAPKSAYDEDAFPLPAGWKDPLTSDYLTDEKATKAVKVKTIIKDRCARCHSATDGSGAAVKFPLDTWDGLKRYLPPTAAAQADAKKPEAPAPKEPEQLKEAPKGVPNMLPAENEEAADIRRRTDGRRARRRSI